MKKFLFFLLSAIPATVMAQQPLNNAIVKVKMETSTDNTGGGGDGGAVFQMAGQETEMTAYIKDSMRKVVIKNNFMNNITIYDGKTGTSTILTESMGEKTGFTQNEAQRQDQRRRTDSIIKAQSEESGGGQGGRMTIRIGGGQEKTIDIAYTEETKLINKINCKKAVITTQNNEGVQKKIDVWYSPDYTLPAGVNIGRGAMNFSGLKGMPVLYEQANVMNFNGNEMTMTTRYEVTSIETAKTIDDKEFAVPKGYTIKTWDEYIKENPEGPNMRRAIRIGS